MRGMTRDTARGLRQKRVKDAASRSASGALGPAARQRGAPSAGIGVEGACPRRGEKGAAAAATARAPQTPSQTPLKYSPMSWFLRACPWELASSHASGGWTGGTRSAAGAGRPAGRESARAPGAHGHVELVPVPPDHAVALRERGHATRAQYWAINMWESRCDGTEETQCRARAQESGSAPPRPGPGGWAPRPSSPARGRTRRGAPRGGTSPCCTRRAEGGRAGSEAQSFVVFSGRVRFVLLHAGGPRRRRGGRRGAHMRYRARPALRQSARIVSFTKFSVYCGDKGRSGTLIHPALALRRAPRGWAAAGGRRGRGGASFEGCGGSGGGAPCRGPPGSPRRRGPSPFGSRGARGETGASGRSSGGRRSSLPGRKGREGRCWLGWRRRPGTREARGRTPAHRRGEEGA